MFQKKIPTCSNIRIYNNECQYCTGIKIDIQINGIEVKVLYTVSEHRGWIDNGWKWLYEIVGRDILREL